MKNTGSPLLKKTTGSLKKNLKAFYLILSSLFLTMLHLPFSFAKMQLSAVAGRTFLQPATLAAPPPAPSPIPFTDTLQTFSLARSVYDSLKLNISGLSRQAFEYAQKGWQKLVSEGLVFNESVLTIIDFSQPSNQKRLYILDMKNYKVLFNTLVAHGRNSGKEWASSFSNRASSFKSSPGFYVTGETYNGDNGYSLKLTGVEHGINDNAMGRAIVMHGADYVDQSYIDAQGYIGRSLGCPAVPRQNAAEIINTIKEGACLFVYTPGNNYISHSPVLKQNHI